MARAKRSPPRWRPDVGGVLLLQQRYFRRVADYADAIGRLAAGGSLEPGAWIQGYATFLSGVIGDAGDFVLGSTRELPQGDDWLPICRGKLHRAEGATALPLPIPRRAFAGEPGDDPKVTLMTDGLLPRGGGLALVPGKHLSLHPEVVLRSRPQATLKMFGLREVVAVRTVYDGVVWAKETRTPVAVVEITVQ